MEFKRTALLLGADNMKTLQSSRVAIFGIGGVGSFVAEGLCRCGVGSFALIDSDAVHKSNLNRQIHATQDTIGRLKVEAMKERMCSISPDVTVDTYPVFVGPNDVLEPYLSGADYVVDAVDTVSCKLALIAAAKEKGIPIISCMGTGNKLDPTRFQVADISKTSVCPLCRVVRRELKKRGIFNVKVLFSDEEPYVTFGRGELDPSSGRAVPASVSFVPSVAGLIIAGEVVKDLCSIG